jgi:hypothetical protein
LSPSPLSRPVRIFARALWLLATTGLAIAILFGVSYVLGHKMLSAGRLAGDAPAHLGYAYWLDQYFPNIPDWYPLQGGGESMLHGYPILAHLLVVVLRRASQLSLAQAFYLVGFLSIPITATGIFAYAWIVTKRQSVGFIAGFFFILAPINWTWIYDWGFFPQGVAMVLLPLGLIFVDRFFEQNLRPKKGGLRRLWLVGASLTLCAAILAHPAVGAGIVAAFILNVAASTLINGRSLMAATLKAGVKSIFAVGLLSGLIMSAYMVPFYVYAGIANRDGLNVLGLDQLPRLPIAQFLGLRPIDPSFVLNRVSNPLGVVLLFAVGLVFAGLRSRKQLPLMVVAVIAAIYSLFPALPFSLGKISPALSMLFGMRSTLVIAMVLLPVGAAFGAYSVSSWLTSQALGAARRVRRQIGEHAQPGVVFGWLPSGISMVLAAALALELGGRTSILFGHAGYGPYAYGVDARDIWAVRENDPCLAFEAGGDGPILCSLNEARARLNIEEFLVECLRLSDVGKETPALCGNPSPTNRDIKDFLEQCSDGTLTGELSKPCSARVESLAEQLSPSRWPPLQVRDNPLQSGLAAKIESYLPPDRPLRVEISPHMATLAQDFASYSGVSQIASYTQQLSLIHLMWGYEIGVLFADEGSPPQAVNDLAEWLGLNYVILHPDYDSSQKLAEAGWPRVGGESDWELWASPDPKPILSATTRPAFLVIGSPDKNVYYNLFRLANEGALSYDQGLLVEGGNDLDRYSLKDLENFDAVFLHGYTYSNGARAWGLLYDYVNNGGSIFIDTGWQFEIPEWEFEDAPPVLPAASLQWTNYGRTSEFELGDRAVAGDVSAAAFSPLIWEQDPWSVSSANATEVRDWGRPVLSVEGHPIIIAGELGRGRVVWSGMNLLSHIVAYQNDEEATLLRNMLSWLEHDKQGSELGASVAVRENPDTVEMVSEAAPGDVTWLYWREAYYPDWHAYLKDDSGEREVPVYRAGPGFMLMPVQTSSEIVSLRLTWELSPLERLAVLPSALGLLFVGALLLDGLFLDGNGFTWLRIALTMRMPSPILDEEANLEMAEAQKAELERRRRGLHFGRRHATRTGRPAERRAQVDALPETPAPVVTWSTGDPTLEERLDGDQQALLQSWLESTGHDEDAWASRLIGRKKIDGQARQGKGR